MKPDGYWFVIHPMLRPVCLLRYALLGVSILALSAAARAAVEELVRNSPFVPPGNASAAAAPEGGGLELRSIMTSGQAAQFSIYDATTKRATWVSLNDKGNNPDLVVKNYDANTETVSVDYRGRPLTLPLQRAKIAVLPVSALPMAAMPMLALPPAGATLATVPAPPPSALVKTVKVNPTPAEEAQRLQAVVEEIRRRRELREQTGQQQTPQLQPAQQGQRGQQFGQQQQQGQQQTRQQQQGGQPRQRRGN